VRFEWDDRKNKFDIRKHGFDFADAWEIFEAPMLTAPDRRKDYGEERWIGVGFLKERIVVIVFTEQDDDAIRITSLRKALKHERLEFEEAIRNGLDAN
jgi:uncharacterized protein